jgi:hypothetical protein
MEQDRRVWNTLETTVSYKARARLTPTLTHVVTYELVTSGAEDRAMSVVLRTPNAHKAIFTPTKDQLLRVKASFKNLAKKLQKIQSKD